MQAAAPCTCQSRGVWAPRASLAISFKAVPQALEMLVAERPRAAPKEGILFRHQPFAPAKPEETEAGALTSIRAQVGSKQEPRSHTQPGGQSFPRREDGGGSAPAYQGCGHLEDRNHELTHQS